MELRNETARRERRFLGASADKEMSRNPYDIRVLDKMVTRVAREIRLLDQALKTTNARTVVVRLPRQLTTYSGAASRM